MELERPPVHPVGAGLGEHADLAAGAAAELGAVGVGFDAEFANRIEAERRAGGAARGSVREVVLQGAVEQVDVRPRVLPVDRHAHAVCDDRPAVAMREGEHPGLQHREIGVIAAVQRDLFDLLRRHQVAQLRARGVDDWCFAGHDFDDGDIADLQADVQSYRLRDRQQDVGAHVRLEPAHFGAQLILPRRQLRDDVAPAGACRYGASQSRGAVLGRYSHSGQGCPRLVQDDPADGRRRLRRRRSDKRGDENREYDETLQHR